MKASTLRQHRAVDHGRVAEHHRVDDARMHDAHELAQRLLEQQQHAHHLDAAAGRAGAGGEAASNSISTGAKAGHCA